MLETLHLPLAAVEAIAGQSRLEIVFVGRANHAGTTPMDLRFDAVTAAAEWITTVERAAKAIPGLVATVGSVQTKPGATNVIASETRLTLDVRHRDDHIRNQALEDMVRNAEEIAQRRGLSVRSHESMNQPAVPMDPFLVSQVEAAIAKTGCQPHRMASGAGHDAMILAEKIPSAMIFLRTPDGVSHDPAESVSVDDVALAIECGHASAGATGLGPNLPDKDTPCIIPLSTISDKLEARSIAITCCSLQTLLSALPSPA